MLAVVDSLAAKGFVVAAIDFPLHGGRAWCASSAQCGAGGVCTPFPGGAGQGDAVVPGTCTTGAPLAAISGQYFISGNFFRTRDVLRQNLIDQAALVLALARPPSVVYPIQPASNPFAAALAGLATPLAVDPATVYWEGISLGAISGTEVVSTNPRFSRAVLSVGGATLADVFTNSPAFTTSVEQLFTGVLASDLAAAGLTAFTFSLIDSANPPCSSTVTTNCFSQSIAASYLKTINVAKWILDPADPLNYADHLRTTPFPDLLADPTGTTPQPAKDAWGMMAKNDNTVPNPFNYELFETAKIPYTLYSSATATNGTVSHGFLATVPTAQTQAADWLTNLINPGASVVLP
jgi:pimeloyl-ACP methyl ester carboxylesterase